MILSILNPKGGSGKTTLSVNLARALLERGRSVLLVDTDPQGSARDWLAAEPDNPVDLIALDRANGIRTVTTFATGYDVAVLDGAAKLADLIPAVIRVSDYVLIPVQPSPYDVWAVSELVDLITARRQVTEGSTGCGVHHQPADCTHAVGQGCARGTRRIRVADIFRCDRTAPGLSTNCGGGSNRIRRGRQCCGASRDWGRGGRTAGWSGGIMTETKLSARTAGRASSAHERMLAQVREETLPMRRLNIEVEEDLFRKIKMQAVQEDRSVAAITRSMWVAYLNKCSNE